MSRVLVVEDEPALARALAITLRARRYDVAVAVTGGQALEALARETFDVVLLDLGLPDLDGMDVLAALRAWTSVPVVVVSARRSSGEKVAALDAGADDYVHKPFDMDELLARVRSAVRRGRSDADEAPVVATAGFVVDIPAHEVRRGGGVVRLTPTEWQLLEALAREVGRIVGQKALLERLRGPHLTADGHYLRVYMGQLRRKLEDDPARPRHLITEPGIGYRLVP